MKIFISADIEGVAGVVHDNQGIPGHHEYAAARELMVGEVNAAIAGAFEAGATEVYVNDSHNTMRNLLAESLDERVMLVSGTFKPQSMMAGLDASFAAVIYTGYHAKAHTPKGVLAHTYTGSVFDARINGVSVGEYGLNALVAGAYKVPIVCVTGDDLACKQTRALLGKDVVGVVVKHGLTQLAAISVHPKVARERIREGVAKGIKNRANVTPYQPSRPISLELEWRSVTQADLCENIPSVERVSERTVRYSHTDPLQVFRAFEAMIDMSSVAQSYED